MFGNMIVREPFGIQTIILLLEVSNWLVLSLLFDLTDVLDDDEN